MRLPWAFHCMYPKRVFDGEHVKMLCSNPRKALPCMNTRRFTRLLYHMSKSVQRPNRKIRGKILRTKK